MERPEEPRLFMLFHPDFFHATPEKFCQFDGRPSLFKSVFNKAFEKLYHSLKTKKNLKKKIKLLLYVASYYITFVR